MIADISMEQRESIFRFTEAFGCGEILKPMLASYLAHHEQTLHVFGFPEDLAQIRPDPRIKPIAIDQSVMLGLSRESVESKYKRGHGGTAFVWSQIFTNLRAQGFRQVIHLDSDVIFLGEVLSEIESRLAGGFQLVGPRRRYRHTSTPQTGYRKFIYWFVRDAVDTHCFGMDLANLPEDTQLLEKRINGGGLNRLTQRIFPVIDFFDRVTFSYFSKSKVCYLDSKSQSRHLSKDEHERGNKLRDKLIVFSAVGSGCSFSKSSIVNVNHPYTRYALESYALYSKCFLGQEIVGISVISDLEIEKKIKKLDQSSWTLKDSENDM